MSLNDVSLYNARSVFESSVGGDLAANVSLGSTQTSTPPQYKKLTDPTLIDEEINYFKQYLSKLKFLYLEQETRDKFIRNLLVEDKVQQISNADVDTINQENNQAKQTLKNLKQEINDTICKIDTLSVEVIDIHESYESKLGQVTEMQTEIDHMNTQLDDVLKQLEDDEDHRLLLNLQQTVANFDVQDLNKILEISETQLSADQETNQSLDIGVGRKKSEIQHKKKELGELNAKLDELLETKRQLEQAEDEPQVDETQIMAQAVKQLNGLVSRIANTGVDVSSVGKDYQVTFSSGWEAVVTKELKIRSVTRAGSLVTVFNGAINDINSTHSESKQMLKLLKFLLLLQ